MNINRLARQGFMFCEPVVEQAYWAKNGSFFGDKSFKNIDVSK